MDPRLIEIFRDQVIQQCQVVLVACEDIDAAWDAKDAVRFWVAIQNCLTGIANISKALWGQGGKYEKERTALRASLHVADSSPIRPTRMRNHFEHFDERLDYWWAHSNTKVYVDCNVAPTRLIPAAAGDIFRNYDLETNEVTFGENAIHSWPSL